MRLRRQGRTWLGGAKKGCAALALAAAFSMSQVQEASAHGIWGHIHVTAWAIENLPPGELRDFFSDPAVRNAAYFGAAFTDSGYWPNANESAARSYGEHTHWEPFVEDYIQWVIANDSAPFASLESKQRVAFLMGAAAHGLQDEVFDSYMIHFTAEHDDGGQDETDPGTDGFLVIDGYAQVIPEVWLPMDLLLELYSSLNVEVEAKVIEQGVNAMMSVYVSDFGRSIAKGMGDYYAPKIPWTRAHYMDPAIPGSLRSEIAPTMRYIEAIWERLHGRFDDDALVVHTFPESPRRLLSGESGSIASVSMMVFGKGVADTTMLASLATEEGDPIAATTLSNQWGGRPDAFTRLVRIRPNEDLAPGAWYRATLAAGVTLIDGSETTREFEHRYQVECASGDDADCPDLGEIPSLEPRVWLDEPEPEPEEPGPESPDPEPEPSASEGCASAGGGSLAGLWAALLAFVLVRRQKHATAPR